MTQDELKVHIEAINAEGDNAMATLTQLAKQTVYSRAHLKEGLSAIIAILNGDGSDPAVTLEMVPGHPREQR